MGLLKDVDYWNQVLTKIWPFRPTRARPLNREEILGSLRVACEAFTKLLEDPELDDDIRDAVAFASEQLPQGFPKTIDQFLRAEAEHLRNQGTSPDQVRRIIGEIEDVHEIGDELDADIADQWADRIRGKLEACKRLACKGGDSDGTQLHDNLERVRKAVVGVTVVAGDFGAIAAVQAQLPGLGGMAAARVMGLSIGYGFRLVGKALKGRW